MSNIITDTIEFLQGLARKRIVEIDGRKYEDNGSSLQPIMEPSHPVMCQSLSLTGLVDYLNHNPDGLRDTFGYVVVEDFRTVSVVTSPYGPFKQRDLVAQANHKSWYQLDGPERGALRTGVETMIVTLMTCFDHTDDRQYLLNLISNIKIDDETHIEDDGLSQSVAVKTGITTIERQKVRNVVTLKPRLTFPEIDQPEIMYVVRLGPRGKTSIRDTQVRLFPQEDISWQKDVATNIREFLTKHIPTVVVIR